MWRRVECGGGLVWRRFGVEEVWCGGGLSVEEG